MYGRRNKRNAEMKLIHHYKIFCYFTAVAIIISFFLCITNGADTDAKEAGKLPMLLDFGAKKCIPCKKMKPLLDQITEEHKEHFIVKFTDVWIPGNVQEAKKYKITSIPTQIFLDKNGKELWRHVGYISKEDIVEKWKSLGYSFNKSQKDIP
jgi:thioredoxin 1